jgi:ABC-2 type transport system permease protein
MPGLARSTLLIAAAHLARIARARRTLLCAALALLPAAVAGIEAHFTSASAATIATHVGWFLVLQVLAPILALVLGSAVVAEELEDRTATYLFARPIPRAAVLLGRYLATAAVLCAVMGLAVALALYASRFGREAGLGPGIAGPLVAAALLGVLVYAALYATFGVVFRYPMIVGLAYAFVLEGFLSNLPGGNQSLTVQYHLRSLVVGEGAPAWRELASLVPTVYEDSAVALRTLCAVLLVALAFGAWRISRKEYLLSS